VGDDRLHVVVVAYGAPELLDEALAALDGRFPVTIVDNSSDDAVARVAQRRGARYLDPGANLGFAAAVNRGLATLALPSVDVLLLNPDARLAAADVERLHDALRADPSLGCVGPGQRQPGATGAAPSRWPWHTPASAWAEALGFRRGRPDGWFLSGAALMLRGTALADVGGLDERFFLYAEDEDWQRRALGRGWRLGHRPEIVAEHASGGTETDLGRLQLRLHAAAERYVRKWYGAAGWAVYRSGVVSGQLVRVAVRRGARRRAAARLAGLYLRGPDRVARRQGAVPGTLTPARNGHGGRAGSR
jgi:GT2 family glycosyltransferase